MNARPIALACTLALLFSACGGSTASEDAAEPTTTETSELVESAPQTSAPAEEGMAEEDGTEEAAAPDQLPMEDAATDGDAPVDSADFISEDGPQPAISMTDAEQLAAFLATPEGMAMMVAGVQDQWPAVTAEEAECFLSSLTPDLMLVYSSIGDMGDTVEEIDFSDPAVVEIVGLVEACGIALSDLDL